MNLQHLINRTNNLLAVVIVSLAGAAFLPEVFIEDEVAHKIDDGLLGLIAVIAIIWYRVNSHRFARSMIPLVFVYGGLLVKMAGMVIEIHDKGDIGDDFGGLILFILASVIVTIVYVTSKHLLTKT